MSQENILQRENSLKDLILFEFLLDSRSAEGMMGLTPGGF
jgi:hypothetical protein